MDYAVTATLIGRIVDDEARGSSPGGAVTRRPSRLTPDQPDRFDVAFVLRGV